MQVGHLRQPLVDEEEGVAGHLVGRHRRVEPREVRLAVEHRLRLLERHDHAHVEPVAAHALEDVQAGHVGQADVEQREVDRLGGEEAQCFAAGSRVQDLAVRVRDQLLHGLADARFIIDEQNAQGLLRRPGRRLVRGGTGVL